jgi:hypothetical protein
VTWPGVALVAVLAGLPASSAAQTAPGAPPSPVSIHRPWVGFGGGWGDVLAVNGASGGGVLSTSFDVPLARAASVRAVAERIWSAQPVHGSFSIRQLSADLLLRRPVRHLGRCSSEFVYGGGVGLYRFAFEEAGVGDETRVGYQVDVGGECIGGRLATGMLVGWRFVEAPDHVMFTTPNVIGLNLTFTVRLRL